MKPYYQLGKEEIYSQLKTSAQGLSNADVAARQKEYGKNEL